MLMNMDLNMNGGIKMECVVFKWFDEDGPNHQVCETYEDVVLFCKLNKNKTFTVTVWE